MLERTWQLMQTLYVLLWSNELAIHGRHWSWLRHCFKYCAKKER